MEPIKTAARHLAAALAAIALAAGMLALAGTAARAGSSYPPGHRHASCARNLPVTHAANWVQMHAKQTCGFSYRAWGDFGGKYRYGTYTKVNGNNSTACDQPDCQGHPDGTLFKGGYQVKRTGKYITTFTVSQPVSTTALVSWPHGTVPAPPPAKACTDQGQQGFGTHATAPATATAHFITNPCGNLQSPELKDNGDSYHYGDHWRSAVGVNSVASSPNSMTNGKAWARWRFDTTSTIWCFRIYPDLGTSWFRASHTPKCD